MSLLAGGPQLESAPTREARFSRLHEEHFEAIRRYVWRREPALADDVVAETFLVAWRRFEDVPPNPRPWLIGVARNVRLNARRTARRQQAVVNRLAETVPESATAGAPAESEAVRTALTKLSPSDREVLLLSVWDDLDRTAVAEVLDCSKANVSLRLHRARRRFSTALAGENSVSPISASLITGGATDVH
jgi:RNA polymerase sigma-70 factor (ECF subfamily)